MKEGIITSTQNPLVKEIVKLHKASHRKSESLAFVEGSREVSIAQQFHWKIKNLIICLEIFTEQEDYKIDHHKCDRIVYVSAEVYKKISYRDGTEGVCAIIDTSEGRQQPIVLKETATILVLESLEKPGNIGAILRTADAAGIDAVILADAVCDQFNPNVIRSSLGCVFAMPLISMSSEQAIEYLKKHEFKILSASLQTENNFYDEVFSGRTAIVFGSEAHGLKNIWYQNSRAVKIPMRGKIDSLNVSASVSAMLFEVVRQQS
jgi:TrmH family RNA methyltransferase